MNSKKNLKRNLLICLLAGSSVMYTLPLHAATSVIANNALPTGGDFVHGSGSINSAGLEMNVIQNGQNAVIKWGSFDIGGSATVNFSAEGAYANNFNTLNYVNSGAASQIYGTINAAGGNIFVVNPAGVQIGNSAQINVGSLYVSSNTLDDNALTNFYNNAGNADFVLGGTRNADIELMSLGNINANKVTFEGNGRIVIDSERIKDEAGNSKLGYQNINITTADTGNVVIGYEAYDATIDEDTGSAIGYAGANSDSTGNEIAMVNGEAFTKANGYMWVEDVAQLQAINTNLSGNYALRNSIDGTGTDFSSLGITALGAVDNNRQGFTGNFDGIDYSIFNLNINETGDNVGLFGYTTDANISNVTMVGGTISGDTNVGAIVGSANNTTLSNVVNSAAVSGASNVGGIVGSANNTIVEDAVNTGKVTSNGANDGQGGTVSNVGGIAGYISSNSKLIGNSYNLGDVSGNAYNVGGLVGHAVDSTIGDGTNLVYNRMDVTGAYNVGGIVGNMEGSTVQNAENSGTVLATGYDDGKYTFHTDYTGDNYSNGGIKTEDVNVANAGGIVGTSTDSSTITDVLNTANVSSNKQGNNDYYDAGNVGGIVGSAVDTNISNATNQENAIRGAHNVGGIAGYFSGEGIITTGINDGGDIMATGARYNNNFVRETIRSDYSSYNNDGNYIIGNIGGVVGYMEGDNVYVTNSANRGTVHTLAISDQTQISNASMAANVGGIVGKIDCESTTDTITDDNLTSAAVSNSSNTGDVLGYTAIGGIAGMMYNGEIAASYNLGAIMSTRISAGGTTPLNMGGIVGDTTENSSARAYLYDVYNKGTIGDDSYNYRGRHVGGIVGRLSGTIEKAYNAGEIYNAAAATGGIVGYLSVGTINNVFNTGNITVVNNDGENVSAQLGGLVGAANIGRGDTTISNAYNLGVIRAFNGTRGSGTIGGVIGTVVSYAGESNENEGELYVENVYTTGDLYSESSTVGAVYGEALSNVTTTGRDSEINIDNVVYITRSNAAYDNATGQQGVTTINYSDMNSAESWRNFIAAANRQDSGSVDLDSTSGLWRVYDGTTPILNAYTPNAKEYFDDNNIDGIRNIQYGTAYNPLLTIIEASDNLLFNWQDLGINNDAGLAVYGAGVTLDNFKATGGTGYYAGLIYADGNLTLDGNSNDIGLGSASQIYGSSVTIKTDGKVTIYGSVTATGNVTGGDITVSGGDVDVYGQLTSATEGESTNIAGIGKDYNTINNVGNITNEYNDIANMGEHYAYTTSNAAVNGNITINAGTKLVVDDNGDPVLDADGNEQYVNIGDGNVNLYYGIKEQGITTTGGDLTVEAAGNVYVDSDLDIGGKLSLSSTGADSEVVLDITNIGQVQAKNELAENPDSQVTATEKLHEFLDHFGGNNTITLKAASGDAKLAVDMWDYEEGEYNLNKFNYNGQTFASKLNDLYVTASVVDENGQLNTTNTAQDVTYIWVSDADQLNGIQNYYDEIVAGGGTTNILNYNFALKNDINASDLADYNVIGTATDGTVIDYNGTFDGRGNRIIGLQVVNDNGNAGIFDTIGTGGTVKNLNVYSSTFTGTTTAGAIAGVNNGTIDNITTFGNTVTVTGDNVSAGTTIAAGGIVGVNSGTVDDVESTGTVIAGSSTAVAGGLVGTNEGTINDSYSNSDVTSTSGTQAGLGGVVGVNSGNVTLVDSLGVTNGTNSSNVGGVIGINNGILNSAYNESIVSGNSSVGGIIGENNADATVSNIVNATSVTGKDIRITDDSGETTIINEYIGGLVGSNSGSVTNGRNNGTITGTNYVGGMVGSNAAGATLTDLVNDSSAEILGEQYVGGIAGSNAGIITADEKNDNLINRGTITGYQYVGGVAGLNTGTITNTNNDVALYVNTSVNGGEGAQYFGGVVGQNGTDGTSGTEINDGIIENATNTNTITAPNASYVGGIVGWNTKYGQLIGMGNSNEGVVIGGSYVGGVIGKNDAAIGGKEAAQVGIANEGTVIATQGGAGGLIGENNAAITNTVMVNSGEVHGNGNASDSGTGGLIGTNNADGIISYSSLKNEVGGTVTGTNNVGGLIGINKGSVTGGRDTVEDKDAGMYINQIYNNGTINVGTYTDTDGDGEYVFAESNGTNIGGLIGDNQGNLTAGYNTGAINASGSTNVGGIAGSNSGKIDQVFNTVMTADGQNEAITGGTNVGGLVGNNEVGGQITNAYNTTDVNGAAGSTGNAVGENNGAINNIYASNTTGQLIGGNTGTVNNAYSFVTNDTSITGVIVIDEDADSDNDGIADRLDSDSYGSDSYGFDFTNGTWKNYDGYSNPLLKVFLTKAEYTGNESFTYNGQNQGLTINGNVSAEDGLKAYNNANSLLQATQNKDAGQNYLGIYSQQIAASSSGDTFNPNNLGYDIDVTYDIDKATISVSLDEINRVYGNDTINNSTTGSIKDNAGYGYTYEITNGTLTEEMQAELANGGIIFEQQDDGAVDNLTGNKFTNDVGDYTWSANFTISNDNVNNYEFVVNQGSSTTTSITTTVNNGASKVTPANLIINADDKNTAPGVMPEFTGSNSSLVNGDTVNGGFIYGLSDNTLIDTEGRHEDVIGVVINGTTYMYDLNTTDWSTVSGWEFLKNYSITLNLGDLTVSEEYRPVLPDLPDLPGNWPHNRWDYLFGDYPFDRNKDFRERKAEVNFVGGGMEV